jgi:hypothetical protein
MLLSPTLAEVLTRPTPEALWLLRADLLEQGMQESSRLSVVIDEFFRFLNQLVASSTAREYSHLASILDMSAVAGVAAQNLLEENDSEDWWQRFVAGAVSEGMMVLAARQYVKAWEVEMRADYNAAAWYLAQEYWGLSVDLQPELAPARRRKLVDQLFTPFLDEQVEGIVKVGLIARLFQILLLARFQIEGR